MFGITARQHLGSIDGDRTYLHIGLVGYLREPFILSLIEHRNYAAIWILEALHSTLRLPRLPWSMHRLST